MAFYYANEAQTVVREESPSGHRIRATFYGKTIEEVDAAVKAYVDRYPPNPYNSTFTKTSRVVGWHMFPDMPFEAAVSRWASCD